MFRSVLVAMAFILVPIAAQADSCGERDQVRVTTITKSCNSPSGYNQIFLSAPQGALVSGDGAAHYDAHNGLLDGDTFRDSYSVETVPMVSGFQVTFLNQQLAFTQVDRTRGLSLLVRLTFPL